MELGNTGNIPSILDGAASHLSRSNKKEFYNQHLIISPPGTSAQLAPSCLPLSSVSEFGIGLARSGAFSDACEPSYQPAEQIPWVLRREASRAALRDQLIDGLRAFKDGSWISSHLASCTPKLEIAQWTEDGQPHARVMFAERCKKRFCPICIESTNRGETPKRRYLLGKLLKEFKDHQLVAYTLTTPSVAVDEARKTISRLREGHSYFAAKWGASGIKYWIEVPVGRNSFDDPLMAQPHIHGIALLPNTLLKSFGAFSIKTSFLWSQAMGVDGPNFTHCSLIRAKKGFNRVSAAIGWINYCCKGPFMYGQLKDPVNLAPNGNSIQYCVFHADTDAFIAYCSVIEGQNLRQSLGAFRTGTMKLTSPVAPLAAPTHRVVRWDAKTASYR